MAREHARILFSIWKDPDFVALDSEAQRVYMLLLSQPNVSWTGLLPLKIRRWSTFSADSDAETIEHGLKHLESAGFIAVDHDTDEVLIRSLIRNDGIAKQPNVLQSALKQAPLIESGHLRHVLAGELRRIPMPESSKKRSQFLNPAVVADEIDPGPDDPSPMPSPNPSPKGTANPSVNPSTANQPDKTENTRSNAKQAEPFGEPFAEPSGEGEGEGERSKGSVEREVSNAGAHTRTRTRGTQTAAELNDTAHSQRAHTLARFYSGLCTKRPPTQMQNQLAVAIDRLINDGYPEHHVKLGIAAWKRKNLGIPLLAQVVNETVNADDGPHYLDKNGIPLIPVDDIPDDAIPVTDVLGEDTWTHPPEPREILEGPHEKRLEYLRPLYEQHDAERRTEARRVLQRRAEKTPAA